MEPNDLRPGLPTYSELVGFGDRQLSDEDVAARVTELPTDVPKMPPPLPPGGGELMDPAQLIPGHEYRLEGRPVVYRGTTQDGRHAFGESVEGRTVATLTWVGVRQLVSLPPQDGSGAVKWHEPPPVETTPLDPPPVL
jgi:hypothetical protein